MFLRSSSKKKLCMCKNMRPFTFHKAGFPLLNNKRSPQSGLYVYSYRVGQTSELIHRYRCCDFVKFFKSIPLSTFEGIPWKTLKTNKVILRLGVLNKIEASSWHPIAP